MKKWFDVKGRRVSKEHVMLVLIMLLGVFARTYLFGKIPGDINQDEALAGYEAYSILKTGKDTFGYSFPVYLTAWGSGMNALNTYLMIPFIAIFGLHVWVIRLPQLLLGCVSIPVTYLCMKRMVKPSAALFSTFFFAISPWHIMLSRWGLESNLAPAFLLFGLFFFLKGLDHSRYFVLSACMYGLSLYCYATIWVVVPAIIVLQVMYALFCKKIKPDRFLVLAGLVLLLMAFPLLLFLLINYGYLEEIRLPFLSVPKLVYMRAGEMSGYDTKGKILTMFRILKEQYDDFPWNATKNFGLYYHCSLPFILLGLVIALVNFFKRLWKRDFFSMALLLFWLGAALWMGTAVDGNINRLNSLFTPMILLGGYGIAELFQRIRPWMIVFPVTLYVLLFLRFEKYYFTDYETEIAFAFSQGMEAACESALQSEGTICVAPTTSWANPLFYSRTDPEEFRDTVEYTNYPNAYLFAGRFGRFEFAFDGLKPDKSKVYILNDSWDPEPYRSAGFAEERFGQYIVFKYP